MILKAITISNYTWDGYRRLEIKLNDCFVLQHTHINKYLFVYIINKTPELFFPYYLTSELNV